ncbi:hypothetical protein SAMN02800687_1524 [Curtobacterium sp. UNCCL20]|uniref:hypothetical protein n=1 Tax=Curtobacterium sp. UNCCL20 TaxID=1502773 RepID=UPI00088E5549|nr:hypothetical protein [Curtobacterium sp. UNCCL20]SDQ34825.1 hypothetical protein SAMN02800687_1524 [Curtobacterium sp. UNCCL20]
MTITVQQIQYTTDPLAWHALARALGLEQLPGGTAVWTEFAGDGVLAVHRVDATADERTEITVLVDSSTALDELERALLATGAAVRRTVLDDIGPLLVVDGPLPLTATVSASASVPGAALTTMPIWYGDDLTAPAALAEAAGLRRRLTSDSGVWADFTADGGGALALHRADQDGVELSFEYTGDLDALAARLTEAGYAPRIVDEAYNRTLRVARPDGPDLWVNGVQQDLYGYTRSS